MATNKRDLKAYSRFDGTGRIVPGSTVLRRNKPKNGNWKETQAYECCDGGGGDCCSDGIVQLVVNLPDGLPSGPVCGFSFNMSCQDPIVAVGYATGFIFPPTTIETYTDLINYLNTNLSNFGFIWTLTGESTIEVTFEKKHLTCNCQNPTSVALYSSFCPS
jgi:hypothetical protein